MSETVLNAFSDIDAPLQPAVGHAVSSGSAGPEPSAEQVGMLADMGFTHAQAKKALRETVSNVLILQD